MKILLVSATNRIVKGLKEQFQFVQRTDMNMETYHFSNLQIDILITGMGSVFTAYYLTKALDKSSYDLVLNIGMAGSFDHFLEQGFVVNVIQDQFSDLGFEDKEGFFTMYEMELMDRDEYPFNDGVIKSLGNFEIEEVEALIPVKGITVNTLLSAPASISRVKEKFNAEIETTEGAAFMYVCLQEKVPFLQLRAISYFVEIKKIENWNIPLAIDSLTESVMYIFKELSID
ncbi:MAG: hypothetical protein JXJ22_08845 [Bacteroidales bacterium]|nr:hypothetical protein [Bacteroidales bacterium]